MASSPPFVVTSLSCSARFASSFGPLYAPSSSLWSQFVCRHNGVRVAREEFVITEESVFRTMDTEPSVSVHGIRGNAKKKKSGVERRIKKPLMKFGGLEVICTKSDPEQRIEIEEAEFATSQRTFSEKVDSSKISTLRETAAKALEASASQTISSRCERDSSLSRCKVDGTGLGSVNSEEQDADSLRLCETARKTLYENTMTSATGLGVHSAGELMASDLRQEGNNICEEEVADSVGLLKESVMDIYGIAKTQVASFRGRTSRRRRGFIRSCGNLKWVQSNENRSRRIETNADGGVEDKTAGLSFGSGKMNIHGDELGITRLKTGASSSIFFRHPRRNVHIGDNGVRRKEKYIMEANGEDLIRVGISQLRVRDFEASSLHDFRTVELNEGKVLDGKSAGTRGGWEGVKDQQFLCKPQYLLGSENAAEMEGELVKEIDGSETATVVPSVVGLHSNRLGFEVKKPQSRSKKRPVVAPGLEKSFEGDQNVNRTVPVVDKISNGSEGVWLKEDEVRSDFRVGSGQCCRDKTSGSAVLPADEPVVSVLRTSYQLKRSFRVEYCGVLPEDFESIKGRTGRRQKSTRAMEVIAQVSDSGQGEGEAESSSGPISMPTDTLVADENGHAVNDLEAVFKEEGLVAETHLLYDAKCSNEEIKSTSILRFPAPYWGLQWWKEIKRMSSQRLTSYWMVVEQIEAGQISAVSPKEVVGQLDKRVKGREELSWRVDESIADAILNNSCGGHAEDQWCQAAEIHGKSAAKWHHSQHMRHELADMWLKKTTQQSVMPTEEPWLFELADLAHLKPVNCTQKHKVLKELERSVEPSTTVVAANDKLGTGVPDVKKEPDMEVEILINSSECTMQRMAILEDKKLVEFSIEPVNTKVQVGNVYLGKVKQLLPGMSGVFVDIGGPRLALLDIARNQYPYTFPPIFMGQSSIENNAVGETLHERRVLDLDGDQQEIGEGVHADIMCDNFKEKKEREDYEERQMNKMLTVWESHEQGSPITVNFGRKFSKWRKLEEGMLIIVQVKKESMGKKGPRLTAFPTLAGRFWVLMPRGTTVGVSARITGPERRRLKLIAQALQLQGLGVTVRTEAVGHEYEDLKKDFNRLLCIWKEIMEKATAAALSVNMGEQVAIPVLLHREMGQILTIIRDFFTDKVSRLVVDSSQSYEEVITYLQEVAPHLISRVVLYSGQVPIFDVFDVEADLERLSNERVKLPNGGYLVLQETEALVSIDVNGGTGMLGHSTRQRKAILEVNLAAAKQIAFEIRLRDIGGIIVVDFIDMDNTKDEKLVHDEMRRAIQRDRSKVMISEISEFGLMEMTRKRVRSSVTDTMNNACSICKGTGRVEALETTLSKIERAIRRFLADHPKRGEVNAASILWPEVLLCIEPSMLEYLKSWKKKRIIQLSNSLKVWITIKVALELSWGQFQLIEISKTAHEKQANVISDMQQESGSASEVDKQELPKHQWFRK